MVFPRIFRDLLSLYGTRAAEVIVPWIYLPFVVRVIGPDLFGTLAIATAVSQFLLVLVEFGYPFSGVRSVTRHRNSVHDLSLFISTALTIRVVISFVVICGVIIFGVVVNLPDSFGIVLILTCMGSLGYALMPQFIFHGLEKFSEFARLSVIVKLISALSIVFFVNEKEDFLLIPLLQSGMTMIGGLYSVSYLSKRGGIVLSIAPFTALKGEFQRQVRVVLSGVAISLYTSANTLFLGMFTSPVTVGYYSAAEKLIRGPLYILTGVQMVMMPRVARASLSTEGISVEAMKRLVRTLFVLVVPISGLLAYYAPEIVTLFYGTQFSPSIILVRMLSPLPLIMVGTIISADLFLLGFGFHREWSRIIITAAVLNIALAVLLVPILNLGANGIVIAILVTEGFVMVSSVRLLLNYCKRGDLE